MKIKLLAVAVAGILLSGCNDDNGQPTGLSVQAFDPAVRDMAASVVCDDGTSEGGIMTGHDGNAKFFELTTLVSPETCEFTFVGGADAVDVSNGKSMEGVTYTIPKGMVEAGQPVTASPLTTLIAKELNGAEYSEATALTVLESLGLDSLINEGLSVTELLSNTEEVLTTLSPTDAGTLGATTAVLSDVLTADPTASVESISIATSNLSEDILTANPQYPASGLDGQGEDIRVEYDESELKDYVGEVEGGDNNPTPPATPPTKPSEPVDPPKPTPPPTGGGDDGTGGTGGGSGD